MQNRVNTWKHQGKEEGKVFILYSETFFFNNCCNNILTLPPWLPSFISFRGNFSFSLPCKNRSQTGPATANGSSIYFGKCDEYTLLWATSDNAESTSLPFDLKSLLAFYLLCLPVGLTEKEPTSERISRDYFKYIIRIWQAPLTPPWRMWDLQSWHSTDYFQINYKVVLHRTYTGLER